MFNLSVDEDNSYIVPVGIAHNCRCTAVQVRKGKYPLTDVGEALERGERATIRDTRGMMRFNPGKIGKTFPDYNPYTIRRCRDCDLARTTSTLARTTPPDSSLCEACIRLHELVEKEAKKRLHKNEQHEAKDKALEWLRIHLPKVKQPNGTVSYSETIAIDATGDLITIGQNFITETFSKAKGKRRAAETMELTTKVHEWLPNAICVNHDEPGIHHSFSFKVYESEYNGIKIQFKAKKTDGLILHILKLI